MKAFDWTAFTLPPKTGIHTNGTPCQDSICIRETDQRLVVVLSDGVGSLLHSQVAAQVTTATAAELLCSYDFVPQGPDHLIAQLLDACRAAVTAEAKKQGLPLSAMDCTLLFAVIFKAEDCCLTGQLGDGAICFIHADSAEKVGTKDDAKAGANMTKTLFSDSARLHLSFNATRLAPLVGILLTSDGLQNELYSAVGNIKSNLQWYFNTVTSQPPEESRRQIADRWEHLATTSPAEFSDDMSLAIIYLPDTKVSLPQDANWLCSCGHRNPLESSRCSACNMDFLKLYQGLPYKAHGGKKNFFIYLNSHPEEERALLQGHTKSSQDSSLTRQLYIQSQPAENATEPPLPDKKSTPITTKIPENATGEDESSLQPRVCSAEKASSPDISFSERRAKSPPVLRKTCKSSKNTILSIMVVTLVIATVITWIACYNHEVSDGMNAVWISNSDTTLSFCAKGDFAKFTALYVDDALVAKEHYTVTEGSAIVTLSAEYLQTLNEGTHSLRIVFAYGKAETTFTVTIPKGNDPIVPETPTEPVQPETDSTEPTQSETDSTEPTQSETVFTEPTPVPTEPTNGTTATTNGTTVPTDST